MGRRMVWLRAGHSQVCGEPPPYTLGPLLVGMVLLTLTIGRPGEWGSRDQRTGSQSYQRPPAPPSFSLLCCPLGWRHWASLLPGGPLPPLPTAQPWAPPGWAPPGLGCCPMPTCAWLS